MGEDAPRPPYQLAPPALVFSPPTSKYAPPSLITPVLRELHWLPVKYRINFKILLLIFKALHGIAPSYISDLIKVKHNTRYSLRSNEGVCLMHPKGRMKKSFEDRSFSVAAPTLWNNLPASLRSMSSISSFKSQLKTHLFRLAFNSF